MTFIYEKVPETDKEKFDALGFKDALHRPMVADGYVWWTIDRERDAILVGLGGGGGGGEGSEIPAFYSLVWQRQWIGFELFGKGRGDGSVGREVWRSLKVVNIPEALRDRQDEVLERVRESLCAKDSDNGRSKVLAYHIEFPAPAFY